LQKNFNPHLEEEDRYEDYRIKGIGKSKDVRISNAKKKKTVKKGGKPARPTWEDDNF
jgi:hypothetical protein